MSQNNPRFLTNCANVSKEWYEKVIGEANAKIASGKVFIIDEAFDRTNRPLADHFAIFYDCSIEDLQIYHKTHENYKNITDSTY